MTTLSVVPLSLSPFARRFFSVIPAVFFRVVDDELKERKLLVEHPNYSVQLTNTIAFWKGTWGFVHGVAVLMIFLIR